MFYDVVSLSAAIAMQALGAELTENEPIDIEYTTALTLKSKKGTWCKLTVTYSPNKTPYTALVLL